ncbi:MAG: TIGR00159 family protein [Bacteroidetes bacterium]|nr:MAG: TIGR00159 family protein [Bacteroidota bacterium]
MFPEILALIDIKFLDILDILLVAFLLYELYNLLKGTVAINIFFGIVAFYLMWKLVTALEMELLSEILGAFISVGFIALIVVFQPEIRSFLLMLGTPGFIRKKRSKFLFWRLDINQTIKLDIDPIIMACRDMSETKTGALIIVANKSHLEQYVETGKVLDAMISGELIENIFFKNSPLHDGAMIIHENKIKAAGCILPVSANRNIPSTFGLRHRAAVGITEQSDAVAIMVSEETGKISYAIGGKLVPNLMPNQLKSRMLEDIS